MTDLIPVESIMRRIVFLRGEKVLLDRGLAKLYDVEVRTLKQAVCSNMKWSPLDFMFELTKEEDLALRSQTMSLKRGW